MDETTQKKLQRLAGILDPENTLTKDEFTKAIQTIIEHILTNEKHVQKAISDMEQAFSFLMDRVKQDYGTNIEDIKGKVDTLFVGNKLEEMKGMTESHISEMKSMMNDMIDKKMKEMDMGMMDMKSKVGNMKPMEGKPGTPQDALRSRQRWQGRPKGMDAGALPGAPRSPGGAPGKTRAIRRHQHPDHRR